MRDKITVGIVDDHALVRAGFVALIKRYKLINIIFEASNGHELLNELKINPPNIILLDIEMPIVNGLDVIPTIKRDFPNVKIIVLSAHAEPGSILNYVKLGAVSFLPKDCGIELLVRAIQCVFKEGIFFENDVSEMLALAGATPKAAFLERKLTQNELTVLRYFNEGKTANEIGLILKISPNAVYNYRKVMLIKTHCEDLRSLLLHAKENKLI